MIKILILTDNIDEWVDKLSKELSAATMKIVRRKDMTIIQTEIFRFQIQNKFLESVRGNAFSCTILDNEIDERIEFNVIAPCLKGSIIRTENYISNIQKGC